MESGYDNRILKYKDLLLNEVNKDSVITRAKFANFFDEVFIKKFCKTATEKDGDADFNIISLVRLLYLDNIPQDIRNLIAFSLQDFVFWPHTAADGEALNKVVFWSENHALMLLSSAVLFRQKVIEEGNTITTRVTSLETELLRCYLRLHCESEVVGPLEVMSFVYLPYTLCSLLNIIDFSKDTELVSMSRQLADTIFTQMMDVTAISGVCSLAVSARTYKRFRLRVWGHAINQVIYLLTGHHPDAKHANIDGSQDGNHVSVDDEEMVEDVALGSEEHAGDVKMLTDTENVTLTNAEHPQRHEDFLRPGRLADFLVCSGYRPPLSSCAESYYRKGYIQRCANKDLKAVDEFLSNYVDTHGLPDDVSKEELKGLLLPLYWSGGLLVHPEFLDRTKAFIQKHSLNSNVHLYMVKLVPTFIFGSHGLLTKGQCYLGMTYNVYKHEELVLSSLENFNGGTCGFQQMPWMLNLDGIGVWSQAGKGSESVGGFDINNTHTPYCSQRGHIMIAAYSAPESLRGTFQIESMLFSAHTRLYWPQEKLFLQNQNRTKERKISAGGITGLFGSRVTGWGEGSWWTAERNGYFVGAYCTCETQMAKGKTPSIQLVQKGKSISMKSRKCSANRHAWIVVVAAKSHASEKPLPEGVVAFPSFDEFHNYCVNQLVIEEVGGSSKASKSRENFKIPYHVAVTDNTRPNLKVEVFSLVN